MTPLIALLLENTYAVDRFLALDDSKAEAYLSRASRNQMRYLLFGLLLANGKRDEAHALAAES